MQPLPVPWNQALDPLAWRGVGIVVDVFRCLEVVSDPAETL